FFRFTCTPTQPWQILIVLPFKQEENELLARLRQELLPNGSLALLEKGTTRLKAALPPEHPTRP
ncbi:hypothetical protein, partial [Pontibacter ummariensis]|uniref:hypothetical protein n=1 Tax=Pontibacter ummariensis TaxID=1610492 RepID=UPI001C636E42